MPQNFYQSTSPDISWWYWHWHTDLYLGLSVFLGVYLLFVGPLNHLLRESDQTEVTKRQVLCFTTGCTIMLFALAGPIHELSDRYLFSAHMAQHIILTLIVPPFLLIGIPSWLLIPVTRIPIIFRICKFLTKPLIAFLIFNGVFLAWHFPLFYETALRFHGFHIVEHLFFMTTGVILWWPVLSPLPSIPRASYPVQLLYLVALSISQTPLFGVITFSDGPIYDFYANSVRIWNISALADQQIGGIVMKLSWLIIFLPAICIVFLRWFHTEELYGKPEFESSSI